ncbi:delta subunit of the central stalk of mitochondrial F1F0 ATP synthase, atp16 [Cladochytrium tenue]|nr:delta subunit of the central stalk of mitochondrial F1F0 ATP synthase, atp16 [Cladochytrium tenue]
MCSENTAADGVVHRFLPAYWNSPIHASLFAIADGTLDNHTFRRLAFASIEDSPSLFAPSILNAVEATQVNVQTSGGDMGILSDHVPSISQLNAGVVEILGLESGKPQKYFVSGGFAIINADSTLNINAVEAFPLEELDAEAARRGLEEATRAETASGASEADKATARIERETFEAILYSLAQK